MLVIVSIILLFGVLLFVYFPTIFPDLHKKTMIESYRNEVSGIAQTVAMGVNIALSDQNFEGDEYRRTSGAEHDPFAGCS